MAYGLTAILSPLPDVRDVLRPAARHDEHRVDADVVAIAHEARRQAFGRNGDTAKTPGVEGEGSGVLIGARLYLDEGKRAPAPGDDIHFSARRSRTAGENAPPVQAQVPAGEGLRAATPSFGSLAVHLRESSRARA